MKSLKLILIGIFAASAFADDEDCRGIMMDNRDNKAYMTVTIGSQTWMAENLNYETEEAYCYNNSANYCATYGRLYTGKAAQNACPAGWHLPSKREFETLLDAVGGKYVAGKRLKSTYGWGDYREWSSNGTNTCGFKALPAGGYYMDGFGWADSLTRFWSSTKGNFDFDLYYLGLDYRDDAADLLYVADNLAFSVRCLKDSGRSYRRESSGAGGNYKSSSFTDRRNGKRYKTVKINGLTWMAENLNYKTDGSYCYENKASNCKKYGRLYEWYAAKKACPAGWHLPSKAEFETLWSATSRLEVGKMLKSKNGWENGNNGIDAYGFRALPAGERSGGLDISSFAGSQASFWSSAEDFSDFSKAYHLKLYNADFASLFALFKNQAYSVRCVVEFGLVTFLL